MVTLVLTMENVVTVWAVGECQLEPPSLAAMDLKEISLINDAGKEVLVNARIADDFQERMDGFQHVCPEVIAKEFILFVFKRPIVSQFHMNNVHAPLDIAFVAVGGTVMNIQTMYPYGPSGTKLLYGPREAFLYALEAPEGYFAKVGISARKSRLKIR